MTCWLIPMFTRYIRPGRFAEADQEAGRLLQLLVNALPGFGRCVYLDLLSDKVTRENVRELLQTQDT